MKAIVFHDVGDIRLDDIAEPKIEAPADAIVKITASAICGPVRASIICRTKAAKHSILRTKEM